MPRSRESADWHVRSEIYLGSEGRMTCHQPLATSVLRIPDYKPEKHTGSVPLSFQEEELEFHQWK